MTCQALIPPFSQCILSPQVATRRWSKDVDRSRYGPRVHVCKNPNLSPIAEKPSPPRLTPTVQQDPPHSCTAPNHETHLNTEFFNDTQATVDLTNVLEDPSEDAVTSPPSCTESAIGKSRKASVQRERSSGPKNMKVSCAEDFLLINQTEGTTEELREDQHTTNQEASRETPVPEEEVDAEQNLHTAAQTPCTDSEGKLENHGSVDAPNSGGGSRKTLTVQRKTSRGRKCSRNICVKMKQAEPLQTLPDEAQEQEDNIRSSSDSQEEVVGVAPVNPAPVNPAPVNPAPLHPAPLHLAPVNPAPVNPAPVNPAHVNPAPVNPAPVNLAPLNLAPWQDYLHFEDVFKPVASRGRRTVRRSLRNHGGVKHDGSAGGMVWIPHTSPESLKESRRKTRGRQLKAAPPL
ncbi:protein piccolo-like [Gymnodraco acuticeps]|uniref:Protein piccolo-like n=1 Tax=Gymnodraco acuticeps TaxID=8218 RepID=A0A6P8VAP6_GYMAC|nr:protein piccolo-like [Gymnodraco acuticeps]